MLPAPSPIQSSKQPLIQVIGEGKLTVQPNQAIVTIGVTTEGMNLTEVQAENSKTVLRIIHSLRELGIPKEKIQTDDYRILMEYDFIDGKQVFRGYNVTHMLRVTIDDINKVGIVVDTAVKNGTTTISNISFTVSNKQFYYNQALSLAVRNAQEKAAIIGHTLGVPVFSIPEEMVEGGVTPEAYPSPRVLAASTETTPISPGQIDIIASVRAKFRALC
ncbi:SIMPL domain-containing protein [Bacillus tianshenii]|nr:SIMPL domain-containing protein [Bacillus tianshenii]